MRYSLPLLLAGFVLATALPGVSQAPCDHEARLQALEARLAATSLPPAPEHVYLPGQSPASFLSLRALPAPVLLLLNENPVEPTPMQLWPGGRETVHSSPQIAQVVFTDGGAGGVFRGLLAGGTRDAPLAAPGGRTVVDFHGDAHDGTQWYPVANIEMRTMGTPSPTNHGSMMLFRTRPLNQPMRTSGPQQESFRLMGDRAGFGLGNTYHSLPNRVTVQTEETDPNPPLGLRSARKPLVPGSVVGGWDGISMDTSYPQAEWPRVVSVRGEAEAAHTLEDASTGIAFYTTSGRTWRRSMRLTAAGVLEVPGGAVRLGTGLLYEDPVTGALRWRSATGAETVLAE